MTLERYNFYFDVIISSCFYFEVSNLEHEKIYIVRGFIFQVMAFYNEPQWAVVGDTFPVGCDWADSVVYRKETFKNNPDGVNPNYK
jgi:hypothetical protein